MILTAQIIVSAGQDAGNRNMRKAGRTKWIADDFKVATREMNRLWDIKEPTR